MAVTFSLADDTHRLRHAIREWSVNEVRPLARESDRTAFYATGPEAERVIASCPIDISPFGLSQLAHREAGTSTKELVALPEGGSNLLGILVLEEMTYGDGWAWQLLPGGGLGERMIQALGTPEQVDRWVGGVQRGEFGLTSIAMTETSGGSDLNRITTEAVRDGDTWVINGEKRFISNGAEAGFIVVFATTQPGNGLSAVRAFVVPKDTPGFTVTKTTEDKLGVRFCHQSTLEFKDVQVPLDHCLGSGLAKEPSIGAALAELNGSRPFCGAWAVGTGHAALDYAKDWLAERRQDYSPKRWARIEDDLDRMHGALDDARRLLMRAAWMFDRGDFQQKEASMAKLYACTVAEQVCTRSLQLMGSEGASEDHLVEKWFRDIRLFEIMEGTGNIQRITIGRRLLGGNAASN